MYIDDCVEGTLKIMNSNILEPINLGSSELVSINTLVSIVEEIAGVKLERQYNLNAPKGVQGRNSDNRLLSSNGSSANCFFEFHVDIPGGMVSNSKITLLFG